MFVFAWAVRLQQPDFFLNQKYAVYQLITKTAENFLKKSG